MCVRITVKKMTGVYISKTKTTHKSTFYLFMCVFVCSTCCEMRPQRCSSLPEDRAMLAAMAGGGLVFRLLQVQISWAKACSVSIRSFTKSHWKIRGLRGVLAAWIHAKTHRIHTRTTQSSSKFLLFIYSAMKQHASKLCSKYTKLYTTHDCILRMIRLSNSHQGTALKVHYATATI